MSHFRTYPNIALVRRYLCKPIVDNGEEMYEHRTTLQVIGLGNYQGQIRTVLSVLETKLMYQVICKCERCYVFEEVRKTPTSFAMPEPMMHGILQILGVTGLKQHTITSVCNPDGSVTTTLMCANKYCNY